MKKASQETATSKGKPQATISSFTIKNNLANLFKDKYND